MATGNKKSGKKPEIETVTSEPAPVVTLPIEEPSVPAPDPGAAGIR